MTNASIPDIIFNRSITSRQIAEVTGKRHDNVVRDIKSMVSRGDINALNFEVVDFKK